MALIHHALRATLLATALAAVPFHAPAADTTAVSAAPLPAGPLGRSLSSFASQRGIALSFDPAIVAGLQAPALPAGTDTDRGFATLLAGSGLQLVARTDGSYTVQRAAPAAAGGARMPVLKVGAGTPGAGRTVMAYGQGVQMGEDALQEQAKGNGDIAAVLRSNPAVQFTDGSRNARNGGEIRPTDFSINGAPFYQNLFVLDGANINNDLDPAEHVGNTGTLKANAVGEVPSSGQGVAVDVDLLESLTVYDANIPASYGGFTGGVVDARSRKAGDTLKGKVWMRMARSAWDELITNPAQEESFAEASDYSRQPDYDKFKLGARLEGRMANGLGIIGSVTRTRSEIPLNAYNNGNQTAGDDANRKTQVRENTAASVALDWSNGEGLDLGANLSWAPTDDTYFIENTKNSGFDIKSGGPVVSLRAGFQQGAWTLRNTLSYSDLETSRRSQVDYRKQWARSDDFNWGINNNSFEGSWGNIDQHDRKVSYRLVADRDVLDLGPTEHTFQFGFGAQHRSASYERLNDHYQLQDPAPTTSCTLADGSTDTDSCSLSPVWTTVSRGVIAGQGQYHQTLMLYRAGKFEVSGQEYEAWVQDDIRVGNWSIRPGLRLDRSSIWTRTTVAPRLAVSWDVLGDQRTVLNAGANRYYGRNFFTYLMKEGREALRVDRKRTSSSQSWDDITPTGNTTANRLRDMDMPYTDEWTVGLDQRVAGLHLHLKYVDRKTRRDVLRRRITEPLDTTVYNRNTYEYLNSGRSDAQTWTLSLGSQRPHEFRGMRNSWQLGADYTDVQRNYNSYEDTVLLEERVVYDGKVMYRYDLPAADYLRPWSARLSTRTETLATGLSWSNFFRIRAGFDGTVANGRQVVDGESLVVLDPQTFPSGWTWDTTVEYRLPLPREQEAYARIEVQNVLNRSNHTSGATASGSFYEPGRSYWLELGYTF